MRVLLVDDEAPARNRLRRMISEVAGVEVAGEAENGVQALEQIEALHPDLMLLDIQMPLLGGFDLLDELRGAASPLVIFVTSYDQYALQAFEVSAVDYLLKPVSQERLAKALARARQSLDARAAAEVTRQQIERLASALSSQPRPAFERIVGRRGTRMLLIAVNDIQAFVADHELVFAILPEGRLLVNYTLRDLEARLDPERFARVHKQTIVNLNHVVELDPILKGGAVARLRGGTTVEISRRYALGLRERLGW
ncbi:MAG TPA: LytTR family DNA-binding domain-containing protein [Bryobacteraceae bacterium]